MRRTLVLIAATLALARPARAAVDVETLAQASWVEVKSAHFNVLTDAGEGAGIGVATRLERFSLLLQGLYPSLRARPVLPVDVFVFRNAASLEMFMTAGAEDVAGFSSEGPGHVVFVARGDAEGLNRQEIVCHEYTHVFLRANFADTPLWMHEGLAQYYETFRLKGQHVEYGHKLPRPAEWFATHEPQPLGLLFAMRPGTRAYLQNQDLRYLIYSEGWAVVHWLLAAPDRAARFDSVLVALREGFEARAAFRSQFPDAEWPALVNDAHAYVRGDIFDQKLVRDPRVMEVPGTTSREVPTAEALERLAELSLTLGPAGGGDADSLAATALAADPASARAQAVRGFVADQRGEPEVAERWYRSAEATGEADLRIAQLAGLGTFMRAARQARRGEGPSDSIHASVVRARERFNRGIRLDENDPESLGGFGATFVFEGLVPDMAYHALAVATDALPARPALATTFGLAREMREKPPAATGATWVLSAQSLVPGERPDAPQANTPAGDMSADAYHEITGRIHDALVSGRYEEAMAELRRLGPMHARVDLDTSEVVQDIARCRIMLGLQHAKQCLVAQRPSAAEDTLATLREFVFDDESRGMVEDMRVDAVSRRLVQRANALLKTHDYKGARAQLLQALELPVKPAWRKYIQDFLAQLDQAAAPRGR
jgi:hypothetical protein